MWAQLLSCPTLCNSMDCRPPGSSVHGIVQARILEWVAMPFSRGSSGPRDQTPGSCISCTDRQTLYHCTTWETQLWVISIRLNLTVEPSTRVQRVRELVAGVRKHHRVSICTGKLQASLQFSPKYFGLSHLKITGTNRSTLCSIFTLSKN